MYIAAVLTAKCRTKLLEAFHASPAAFLVENEYEFDSPSGPLPHHMTINLGNFDETLNPISILGKKAELVVQGFYYDHRLHICATKVLIARTPEFEIKTINIQPHVTMAVRKPGKPANSNKLNWDMTTITEESGHIPTEEIQLETTILIC